MATSFPGLSKQSWPREDARGALDAFYGDPRGSFGNVDAGWESANITQITCPWRLKSGQRIQIHKKCAESLERILNAIWDHARHDQATINAAHLDSFDGSFVYRANVNNPSKLSLHAYGAALDFAANWNPNGKHWVDNGVMLPRWAIDAFLAEGWCWGGDFSRTADPMHFQATFNRHSDAPQDQAQPASMPQLPFSFMPPVQKNTRIIATVFGGREDPNHDAYDGHFITDNEPGCALPFHFPEPRPMVSITGPNGKTVTVPIVDVGPIYPSKRGPADTYWLTGARPRAETNRVLSQAGIDLTPKTAADLSIDGKGHVDWQFASSFPGGDTMPDIGSLTFPLQLQNLNLVQLAALKGQLDAMFHPGGAQSGATAPQFDITKLANLLNPAAPHPGVPQLPPLDLTKLADINKQIELFVQLAQTVLPIISTFVPQLKVLIPILPVLNGLLKIGDDLAQAGSDPTKMADALTASLKDVAQQIQALKL